MRRYDSRRTNEIVQIGGFWGLKNHEARNVFNSLMGESPYDDDSPDDEFLRRELEPLIEMSRERGREAKALARADAILSGRIPPGEN